MFTSMTPRPMTLFILLALYALNVIAIPAVPPTTLADELVKTPGGMMPKSNVHTVPPGGKVVHSATEVKLLDADSNVLFTSPLKNTKTPRLNLNKKNATGTKPTAVRRDLQSATIAAFAQPPSVSAFQSSWELPPLPQSNNGQLLMYFAALAPTNIDALIQPTLQYGVSAAGGGPFWSLASWLITEEQVFVTNITQLPAGSLTLQSFVVSESEFTGTATTSTWFCGFAEFEASGLNIETEEDFTVAVVALEISDAISLADLPSFNTEIDEIFISTEQDVSFSPFNWEFSNDAADGITISEVPRSFSGDETLLIEY